MVTGGLVNNCLLTTQDVDCATKIYGPSLTNLKVKTAKKTPLLVVTDCIKAPSEILNANKNVQLEADTMFVNKMPFLTSISRHIKFTTAENLP